MCHYEHKTITMCKGIMSMALITFLYFLIVLKLIVLLQIVDPFLFVPQKAENTKTVASRGYPPTYSIWVLSVKF